MFPDVVVSCKVNKSVHIAWDAYVEQLGNWWSNSMYTSPETKRFVMETKLGGLLYEDFGNGQGLVWGTLIGMNKPYELLIKGTLAKDFGGPATTIEKLSFKEEDGVTEVTYRIDFVGVVDHKTKMSLKEGWKMILEKHYKPYCENL